MNNSTLLIASIAFFIASGLATWLWFALDSVDSELRSFDGLEALPPKH